MTKKELKEEIICGAMPMVAGAALCTGILLWMYGANTFYVIICGIVVVLGVGTQCIVYGIPEQDPDDDGGPYW